jgi:hypothetical protein
VAAKSLVATHLTEYASSWCIDAGGCGLGGWGHDRCGDEAAAMRWVVWVVGAIGLGLLALGAAEIVDATGEVGAVALVVAGVLLVLLPFVIDRLEQISVSGSGLELHLTQQIAQLGAPDVAEAVEDAPLGPFAESYAFVHDELKGAEFRPAKVYLQDLLVERAATLARRQKLPAKEVRTLFKDGSPTIRVLTLGFMEGDLSLADAVTIVSAIGESRSGNEQYHGLKLAKLRWRELSSAERKTVVSLIEDDPHIHDDADRRSLAADILALAKAR